LDTKIEEKYKIDENKRSATSHTKQYQDKPPTEGLTCKIRKNSDHARIGIFN
jgi:hypothetical protein